MCYLSGTLDESKIVTWWNNTVEWWSNKTAKIKAIFTCPVNVSVYNSSGQQIGYVGDDDIWYTDGLIYIEEKGDAKIVYSFTDDLISFQLSATDYGSLGCCIEKYEEAGQPTGRTNYYDIELYPSKTLSVLGSRDGENTNYKITVDSNVIRADEYIPSNQNAAISVRCSVTSGGTISGAGSYVRGNAVVLLAEPENENCFIGWYQGEDLLSSSRVFEFTAREDIELKAIFNANTSGEFEDTYTIYFNGNGGAASVASMTTGANGKLTSLPEATRTNYTFSGWYTEINGGTQITENTVFDKDATVYAHWSYAGGNGGNTGGGSSSGSGSSSGNSGSSQSSGASGNSTNKNSIAVPDTNGGKITVSPKSAAKGTAVTITAAPDDGYVLTSLTVTSKNGHTVAVTRKGDEKFTFTMPAGKVEISAKFDREDGRTSNTPLENPFADVSSNAYYYDAVRWATEQGITNGTTGTTFSPNKPCTRAQTVTFLWRAAGSPTSQNQKNPFTDVTDDAYYYEAILWAVEQGITTGTSATIFNPNATVTRGQTVTFLYRAAGSPATDFAMAFEDTKSGIYYYDAVRCLPGGLPVGNPPDAHGRPALEHVDSGGTAG